MLGVVIYDVNVVVLVISLCNQLAFPPLLVFLLRAAVSGVAMAAAEMSSDSVQHKCYFIYFLGFIQSHNLYH